MKRTETESTPAEAKKAQVTRRPEGRRLRIDLENVPKENGYYLKVGKRFRGMKFLSLSLLLCYLVVMMCIYRSEITYDNLIYLIKDLDTDVSVSESVFADVTFDEGYSENFVIFKNRLAAVNNASVALYNTAGAEELKVTHSMESPKAVASDKYLLVYDVGKNSWEIFTSLSRVLDRQSEYAIQSGSVSRDGTAFALVTRSRENRYLVDIYDENFREIQCIYKDKYVMDAALSSDGKRYAVVSAEMSQGSFVTEVMSGKTDSDEAVYDTVTGAMPLTVKWFKDGGFAVVCDTGAHFYSDTGERIASYGFTGMTLSLADISDDRLFAAGSRNVVGSVNGITVLDSKGEVLFEKTLTEKIRRGVLGSDKLFFATDEKLCAMDFSGNTVGEEELRFSPEGLISSGTHPIVIGTSRAYTGLLDAVGTENGTQGGSTDGAGSGDGNTDGNSSGAAAGGEENENGKNDGAVGTDTENNNGNNNGGVTAGDGELSVPLS